MGSEVSYRVGGSNPNLLFVLLALLTIASFSRLKEYLQRLEMVQGSTEIMQGARSMEKISITSIC
jgi:hypothetical protein